MVRGVGLGGVLNTCIRCIGLEVGELTILISSITNRFFKLWLRGFA